MGTGHGSGETRRKRSAGERLRGLGAWAAWATILTLPVSIVPLLSEHHAQPEDRSEQSSHNRLQFTAPASGIRVAGDGVDVRGVTSFRDRKHYLEVRPPTGAPFIQGPLEVSESGVVEGRAMLGNDFVGPGLTYSIRIFATRQTLQRLWGPPPVDARFSDPVSVTRKPKG
jgi:hypothetical protein